MRVRFIAHFRTHTPEIRVSFCNAFPQGRGRFLGSVFRPIPTPTTKTLLVALLIFFRPRMSRFTPPPPLGTAAVTAQLAAAMAQWSANGQDTHRVVGARHPVAPTQHGAGAGAGAGAVAEANDGVLGGARVGATPAPATSDIHVFGAAGIGNHGAPRAPYLAPVAAPAQHQGAGTGADDFVSPGLWGLHTAGNQAAGNHTAYNHGADQDQEADKRAKAAKMITPDAPWPLSDDEKRTTAWDASSHGGYPKPQAKELREEVIRRDGKRRPTEWSIPKLVKFLNTHAGDVGTVNGGTARSNTDSPHPEEQRQGQAGKKRQCRWKQAVHMPRLLHAIYENRVVFLQRHQKPPDRNAYESTNRKSCWVNIATSFNSPTFAPALLTIDDMAETQAREECNLKCDFDPDYRADAATLEDKFSKLMPGLRSAMKHFKKSGMGSDASEEMQRQHEADANTVFSTKFFTFAGTVFVGYAYQLLIQKDGLLESAQSEMPPGSGHSSSSDRNVRGGRPGQGGHGSQAKLRQLIAEKLDKPVILAKTAAEKKEDYYRAQSSELRVKRELDDGLHALEQELDTVEDRLAAYEPGSAPQRLVDRKSRLEKRIDEMLKAEKETSADAPDFYDDDVFNAGPSSLGLGKKRRTRRERAGHHEESDDDESGGYDVDDSDHADYWGAEGGEEESEDEEEDMSE